MKAELISLNYRVPSCDTTLCDFPLIIGRAADATIRVDDRSISNYHCRIDEVDGELMVCDLGSVHGTCVNSCRVKESPLKHGDELALGLISFLVQYHKTEKSNLRARREMDNHPIFASADVVVT